MRLLGPAIALLLLVATVAQADNAKLANHLHQLNPGANAGGKSIVGTKPGQSLHGVHGKPNFIIALGDDETIHGASANDELGAIGEDVKIVPSSHGHTLIVGGPHSKIVVTGKGHNLIFSHAKGATIVLESPGDEVIANGPHDKITCAKHSSHELIEIAKGETVSKSCKGHHDTIEPAPAISLSAHSSRATAHRSAIVVGLGTNENPYVAACDDQSQVDCTVSSFAGRTLNGLWANERVPAYQCPANHPYLLNQSYAPFGTSIPKGVEVEGLGPVGVYIEDINSASSPFRVRTRADSSSATNWTLGSASYRVILHCTSNSAHGFT
jgi:hypothetical protein